MRNARMDDGVGQLEETMDVASEFSRDVQKSAPEVAITAFGAFSPYSSSLTGSLPSAIVRPNRSRRYPSMAFRTLSFKTPLRMA